MLYDERGEVLAVTPHPYGRVPIVRLFDRRKARCQNIGHVALRGRRGAPARVLQPRLGADSVGHDAGSSACLQGPEDYVQADGAIPLGPSWLLPKKRNSQGTSVTYEGFEVIDFPKEGADSIRSNKADLREEVDRDAALVRPTGRDGVALSGLAKMLDQYDGNNRLAKIARVLARAEQAVAELALAVLGDGVVSERHRQEIQVVYPTDFDLFTASDVAAATADFQAIVARSGALPETEGLLLARLIAAPACRDSATRSTQAATGRSAATWLTRPGAGSVRLMKSALPGSSRRSTPTCTSGRNEAIGTGGARLIAWHRNRDTNREQRLARPDFDRHGPEPGSLGRPDSSGA